MKSYIYALGVLFCVHHAFAEDIFLGHYENYDLPPPGDFDTSAVTTQYFSQVLDHYDPTNTARWLQRYYVNTQHYNTTNGVVVFLLIGGEGQASIQWMSAGAWIQTAREYGALLFQLEHRFYGESQPLSDLSIENLRFLSSQQALEDIATFIGAMNSQYNLPENVQWILFGGSYSGALAAWSRQKYPHLIQGAVASSSPVYAHLDFYEYFEVVANGLARNSQQCSNTMKKSFEQLEYYINNPAEENITALLNLCLDINLEENRIADNIAYLFERLSSNIASVVQYHGIAGMTTIDAVCDVFNNEALGREIDRLAGVARLLYGTSCVSYRFQALINTLSNTAILSTRNSRQWYYQTCTEYGWYQTSGQRELIIGNRTSIDFFTQICSIVFGSTFTPSFTSEHIERTNRYYGGYDPEVTNVLHVHGSLDPWYPMGITETENPESPVIFIDGTSHCTNLYPISVNDPPALTQARERIDWFIGVFLGRNSAIRIHLSISLIIIGLLAKIL